MEVSNNIMCVKHPHLKWLYNPLKNSVVNYMQLSMHACTRGRISDCSPLHPNSLHWHDIIVYIPAVHACTQSKKYIPRTD